MQPAKPQPTDRAELVQWTYDAKDATRSCVGRSALFLAVFLVPYFGSGSRNGRGSQRTECALLLCLLLLRAALPDLHHRVGKSAFAVLVLPTTARAAAAAIAATASATAITSATSATANAIIATTAAAAAAAAAAVATAVAIAAAIASGDEHRQIHPRARRRRLLVHSERESRVAERISSSGRRRPIGGGVGNIAGQRPRRGKHRDVRGDGGFGAVDDGQRVEKPEQRDCCVRERHRCLDCRAVRDAPHRRRRPTATTAFTIATSTHVTHDD